MSTGFLEGHGNGPGTEDVDKDKLVTASADPAPAQPSAPNPDDADVDDLALIALRQAVEAEESGSGAAPIEGQTQADADAGGQPPVEQEKNPDGTPKPGKPKMVPIERFQQVYTEKRDLQAEVARLAGENLALKSQAPPTQPTINPQIADLNQQITALAQKFDDGLMTYSELKQQEQALQVQIDRIREDEIVAKASQRVQPAPAPAVADLTFQRETQRIEAAYEPFMELIPDAYLDGFVATVRSELAAQGITVIKPNSEELLLFREMCGQRAQQQAQHWSNLSGKAIPKPNGQPAPKPTTGNQPTVEQRRAKLEMQSDFPPNLANLNRSGGVDDAPTEATIEGMSDEEIAALPTTMRHKLMGVTP